MSRLERRTVTGVLFALVLYASLAIWADAHEVLQHTTSFPLLVFIGALGLSVVNYGFRYWKWVYYLRLIGVRVEHRLNIPTFLAGFSMAITPGKVGEVLKSALLFKAAGIPIERTAPIVLAERLTDLLALIVIASFGSYLFGMGAQVLIGTFLVLLIGMWALQREAFVKWALDRCERWALGRTLRPRLEEAYRSTRRLLAFGPMLISVSLSVVSWSMEGIAFWWLVDALGGEMTLATGLFVFSLSTILGALSFLPGGLGVSEGSMLGMLVAFNVFAAKAPAVLATYLIRFTTLWFAVLLGGLALWWHRRHFVRSQSVLTESP